MNAYSPFKAAHHREKIDALKKGELITPVHIQIDPTGACNFRCPYCFYRLFKRDENVNHYFSEEDFLPYELVEKLLKELRELKVPSLQFTGGGEPTLHPRIGDILKLTLRESFEFSYVTNGSLLTDELIKLLRHASWVRLSIDSATSKTFERVHRVDCFQVVLDNLKRLCEQEREAIVGFSFVINPLNWTEIVEATVLAREIGCDNIRFSLAYTPKRAKLHEGYWNKALSLLREAKRYETESFRVFTLTERMDDLRAKGKNYSQCYYQHFVTVVGSDGRLYPCCTYKGNKLGVIGNLYDKDFKTLWFRDRVVWLENLDVSRCMQCWMDEKNAFISYLVEEPIHVNFI